MTKKQRVFNLVIETIVIVVNLSEYFTITSRVYKAISLTITIVVMCLFILDWNALVNKPRE